jgi:putative transport protein
MAMSADGARIAVSFTTRSSDACGVKVFKLNSIIADGATTGGRNSTPGLNAIIEESNSSVAAVPYPVSYALTTVLALIGGYFSMIFS